ncbi:MAG TPA: RodZ domain-containing protein, partial [Gammaproteobacteria bacterium]|nr:RodZ domain-containing protein [Gammaproteobacteria bacterium]
LTVEQIQALETEDFSNLPGEAYIRGYLRNYAASVGLSPDAVIRAYEGRDGEDVSVEEESPLIPEPERPLIEHPWRVVSISLVMLLLVGGATFWFVGDGGIKSSPEGAADAGMEGQAPVKTAQSDAEKPASGAEEQAGAESRSASGPAGNRAADSGAGQDASQAGGAQEPAKEAASSGGGGGGQAEDMQKASAESAKVAAHGADSRFRRLKTKAPASPRLPQDMQVLRVHTWAKAWMQVKDAKDNLLLRRLVKPDQDLRLYGQAPFRLKVGNAAGVQLYFNGKPLAPLGRVGQVVHTRVDSSSKTIPKDRVAPPPGLRKPKESKKAGSGGGQVAPAAAKEAGSQDRSGAGSQASNPDGSAAD